jgi:hypothetical protein
VGTLRSHVRVKRHSYVSVRRDETVATRPDLGGDMRVGLGTHSKYGCYSAQKPSGDYTSVYPESFTPRFAEFPRRCGGESELPFPLAPSEAAGLLNDGRPLSLTKFSYASYETSMFCAINDAGAPQDTPWATHGGGVPSRGSRRIPENIWMLTALTESHFIPFFQLLAGVPVWKILTRTAKRYR